MARRIPNTLLRELLAEAGWTGDALARSVNSVGVESGVPLRYNRSSVAHWLTGTRPRSPVPVFVAEAFSRRLGRRVTMDEIGFGAPGSPVGGRAEWWEADVASRLMVGGEISTREYRVADLAVPDWDELVQWLMVSRATRSCDAGSGERVRPWQVRSAERMVNLFSEVNLAFGGGYARVALAEYLAASVGPWLHASAPPAVARELLRTASRLTYLCGFMHFDDEVHGAAQHYYLTNLRLAAESGDRTCYAVTLRATSEQALQLGHHENSLRLAETAVRTVGRGIEPRTTALLVGQLAVAQAATGNRRDAVRHLRIAEQHLDGARDSARAPLWLAHQRAAVHTRLGDRDGAIQALESSIRQHPVTDRRSRAIALARLAELHLDKGELDAACGIWHRLLQDYPHLRCRRVSRALASMRARLRPHRSHTVVNALWRKAAAPDFCPGPQHTSTNDFADGMITLDH